MRLYHRHSGPSALVAYARCFGNGRRFGLANGKMYETCLFRAQ